MNILGGTVKKVFSLFLLFGLVGCASNPMKERKTSSAPYGYEYELKSVEPIAGNFLILTPWSDGNMEVRWVPKGSSTSGEGILIIPGTEVPGCLAANQILEPPPEREGAPSKLPLGHIHAHVKQAMIVFPGLGSAFDSPNLPLHYVDAKGRPQVVQMGLTGRTTLPFGGSLVRLSNEPCK